MYSSTGKRHLCVVCIKIETLVNYLDLVMGIKIILFVLCAMFIYELLKIAIVLSSTTQLHTLQAVTFTGCFPIMWFCPQGRSS